MRISIEHPENFAAVFESVTKNKWAQWQSSFPELVSSLVYIYRNNDRLMDAELILSDWVDRNPSDKNAKKILEEIRSAE